MLLQHQKQGLGQSPHARIHSQRARQSPPSQQCAACPPVPELTQDGALAVVALEPRNCDKHPPHTHTHPKQTSQQLTPHKCSAHSVCTGTPTPSSKFHLQDTYDKNGSVTHPRHAPPVPHTRPPQACHPHRTLFAPQHKHAARLGCTHAMGCSVREQSSKKRDTNSHLCQLSRSACTKHAAQVQ